MEALTEEEQAKQINKADLFHQKAHLALQKHFDGWLNRLLFLALYSEAPTGAIVARFLLNIAQEEQTGGELAGEEVLFDSPFHNRSIKLTSFAKFVASR